MRAKQLNQAIKFAIKNKYPLLIKGAPGIGKTDIVAQACLETDTDLIISHPVVSDPTDFKGLPFPNKDGSAAKFLPFGDLLRLIAADKPTVYFLDDLGQASVSVQAAAMQLLLARRINGHAISEHVVFLAATNRRQDRAGVQGILEPVKSRFAAILELEVNVDDWVDWAIEHNMPVELIAFVRFRPNLLHDFKPTADIINTPNPRTVAAVGMMMNAGLPKDTEYEMISGAAGEGFAAEFLGFLKVYRDLPDIEKLIAAPENADVPEEPSTMFAVCGALSAAAKKSNFGNIIKYTDRLPGEFQVLLIKDAIKRSKSLTNTKEFSAWAIEHADVVL
ncbi:MAG: ATP-binding protein [Candidatus Tenebribacter davisii]|nr:ATP-binding protein [Candidatus Tenebribacter davisii]